ncbi:glutamine amidotransferase [Alphaproteobacteria bacterium]|jgi:GMP synthase (glutamine-hydrolysing)|nr:glutamine amidotransferase [Alphaproteobacteria bacterium]
MSKEVVLVYHTDGPTDDRVFQYFSENGFDITVKRPFQGDKLGEMSDQVVGSVVFGGPFNVFEEDKHPFLHDENQWIQKCIDLGVPLLGICQGAQSIARVLGAECGPRPGSPHEFGYYEILPTEVAKTEGFLVEPTYFTESHFHEFSLPVGAELLACSEAFPQQAFRYGDRVYALQFHAECTASAFQRWQKNSTHHEGKAGVQSKEEQDALQVTVDPIQHDWFMTFMTKLFGHPAT